jgi:hypothetical protein
MEAQQLREVAVYYKNIGPEKKNQVHAVNMAAGLTDEEIHAYYRPGRLFNIGAGPYDLMAEVDKVEIIK